MSAQPTNDDFICPECGGRHFGRDTQATVTGEVIANGTVRCHDEHGKGCRWRGEWPPLDAWERQMITDQLRLGTAEFRRRLESQSKAGQPLPASHGSALLRRLQSHRAMMSPEQKERHAGKLLLDATEEIDRLIGICTHVHDRMLRGDDDMTLMRKLQEGWQGPNSPDKRNIE